ncbi:hypothetical protein B296_00014655 [Ensete ventricosum]|uniref:Uncharacterized protein n=1 Tax=Ensete ventricosum TaxID=4639 RepID=A0A427AFL5_ENSVE|nr:hypothetical protein B296_00014655 [Ensete ventricosum]
MSYEHSFMKKNATVRNLRKVKLRSIFRAPSRNFKILAIPNLLAHGKSYEHGFAKKCDDHKFYAKSRFDQFFVHHLSRNFKILTIPNVLAHSNNFKILAIPNVLAHGKSYEHGFVKKYDGYKFCVKSCFDRFFVHRLKISKYWPFPTY